MKSRVLFLVPGLVVSFVAERVAADGSALAMPDRSSPHISAAIRAGLPSFDSLPAEDTKPVETPSPDVAPEIVAMPKYIVRDRLGVDGSQMMTNEQLKTLFKRLYPGATLPGNDPRTQIVPNYAELMYRDDQRLRAMSELEAVSAAVRASGDEKQAKELNKEIERAFLRGHNWRDEGLDKSVNGYRR
ncbi:hypothetical protein DB347_13355 [Opitutaceae bacterium EW11]|nr:hypothetical protein DB347_13355 [Opitutaceae bacterium EW11]